LQCNAIARQSDGSLAAPTTEPERFTIVLQRTRHDFKPSPRGPFIPIRRGATSLLGSTGKVASARPEASFAERGPTA
jgi:hypothetical protein